MFVVFPSMQARKNNSKIFLHYDFIPVRDFTFPRLFSQPFSQSFSIVHYVFQLTYIKVKQVC